MLERKKEKKWMEEEEEEKKKKEMEGVIHLLLGITHVLMHSMGVNKTVE